MAIYRASLTYTGASVTPAPSSVATVFTTGPSCNVTTGGIMLMAADGKGNLFGVFAGVTAHNFGPGPTTEFQSNFGGFYRQSVGPGPDTLDPFTWHLYPGGLSGADGNAGSEYFTGGTIAIEKDFVNDKLTFLTPMGNIVRTLSETDPFLLESALNDTALWPVGHGQQIVRDNSQPNVDEVALLSSFVQLINGVPFFGFALSAADPGTWQPWQQDDFDQFGGGSTLFPDNNAQLSMSYRQEFQISAGAYPLTQLANEWRYTATNPPLEFTTDKDKAPDHGIVWRAGTDSLDAGHVVTERTFDNGRHWQRHTVFNDPTTSNLFATINWFKTWLIVTWAQDDMSLHQAISVDGGANWNMPATLPYTGTHPRHIIDKNGGIGLYFFFAGTGGNDLQVVRSYDVGNTFLDVAPINVALAVGAQTIDAEFEPDGGILVSLFVAGTWTQYRSTDLGRTWS